MILENKYKINEKVFYITADNEIDSFHVRVISVHYGDIKYMPKLRSEFFVVEQDLYPTYEEALAELNKIKVGDVVYYFCHRSICLKKRRVTKITNNLYHMGADEMFTVFKTESELIESLRSYDE